MSLCPIGRWLSKDGAKQGGYYTEDGGGGIEASKMEG